MISATVRRIRQLILPVKPGAKATDNQGSERNRRAILTGAAATLAKVVQMGTSLVTVPLTLKYLGNERFGLWMTISSVLAMASFADFGVGNGVLNTVATAYGKDDIQGIRRVVSSGFAVLNSIAVFLVLAFFAIYRFVDWGNFFRVTSPLARSEAGPALAVFAVCFALNISMDVVQRVQLGLQQGYRYGLWQLCGSSSGLIGVVMGIRLHVGLPILVIAIAGAPIFATALNAAHFFGIVRPDLRPSPSMVSKSLIAQIAKLGGMFFVLQVVVAISYSADNFIIARTLGAVNVPEYSIPQRLFTLISMIVAMLLSGLWPAYGEAISRGHIAWVKRTVNRSLITALLLSSIAAGTVLLLSHRLLHIWVGSRVNPPPMLLLGLAIWCVFDCCANTISMLMNGASAMRFQVISTAIFGVACLSMKIYLASRFGVSGIPWATISTFTILIIIPLSFYIPRMLKRLEIGAVSPDGYDKSEPLAL